jgi:hypothetical protein
MIRPAIVSAFMNISCSSAAIPNGTQPDRFTVGYMVDPSKGSSKGLALFNHLTFSPWSHHWERQVRGWRFSRRCCAGKVL